MTTSSGFRPAIFFAIPFGLRLDQVEVPVEGAGEGPGVGIELGERQGSQLVDHRPAIAVQLGPGSRGERGRAAEPTLGKRHTR